MTRIPDKPTLDGLEDKWSRAWAEQGTYAFDRASPRSRVYAIDTLPPTVSGSLHVGTLFSYTHTDIVARFQRMRGRAVFYPIGWDDNGLPTERRVQNHYGVRCDPSLPRDPAFTPPERPGREPVAVSRPDFVELCQRLTSADEQAFERAFRTLGLSVDWSLLYTTIGDRARAVAQLAFLRNLARGEAYAAQAPTLWDVDFGTAVAQAELDDREVSGAYHALTFHADDRDLVVETTRPELLPACVALVCHPSDERYAALAGQHVRTPLFGVPVPVHTHRLAAPDKGTGLAMVCTFGDLTDVTWWRDLDLPVRAVVGRDGRLLADAPPGVPPHPYDELAGRTTRQARERVVELLRASGELAAEPSPITHAVNYYEKGERPLEIVPTRQWYIRGGGRDVGLRARLLARGEELRWHPPYMSARYADWVHGLTGDWLVSRQRYFGVPLPVWYPLDAAGEPAYDSPLTPDGDALPVDPSTDPPPGYAERQRGEPHGFVADPDVLDTWATSSLTPQIAAGWRGDPDLFARAFPMDLRPQAHDIIRTWLFATITRAEHEHGVLPWRHAAISGFIYDPDRKKMSKSKGNAVTPEAVLGRYGTDAFRYWAAHGRLGVDAAFDDGMLRTGRRLAIKVLNASRFVLGIGEPAGRSDTTESLDRALLGWLADVVDEATAALDAYEHARAMECVEAAFWAFCDDHLELVKSRAYGERGAVAQASARAGLGAALSALLRMLAPFLPFVTEEVWSWRRDGSVHRAPWPSADELRAAAQGADPGLVLLAAEAIGAVRRAKSQVKVSMRADVDVLTVRADARTLERVGEVMDDIRAAGRIRTVELTAGGPEPCYQVRLL
ncbi:MAG: valine--tRNA ligase [Streptosporangiales bacterium]